MYKDGTLIELKEIDTTKPIFVDTETGGDNYEFLVSIQIYQEHWDKVKFFTMHELPSYAPELIWDSISQCEMVGHNLGYDLLQFFTHTKTYKTPEKWFDTFYASRLVFPTWQEYSLDKCLTRVLGYDPYAKEGLVKKEMQKSFTPGKTLTEEHKIYGSVDVFLLPHLYHRVKSAREDFNFKLDSKIAEYATIMTEMGMPVDRRELQKLEAADTKLITELTKKLPKGLNVNSYIQVRQALGLESNSDEVALRIIASRPGGMEGITGTVNNKRNAIMEPNYKHSDEKAELAGLILEKRKATKRLQFVVRAYANMDANDRITSRFSPHAITGRVQGSDENLSQYPRTMKKMWGINPEVQGDRVLLYSDYSQLELRSICAILPERNMEDAYRRGIDLHTYASQNLSLDESKLPEGITSRFVAKQLNFLALYGGGVDNFQKTVCKLSEVWLETDVCKEAFRQWKDGFSDIKAWHEANAKSQTNMDQTICGRRYKAKSYTDLNNIRNQGTGAEVSKLAWHYMQKFGIVKRGESYIVNMIHDAFIIDSPNIPEVYERIARGMAFCMQKAWFEVMKLAPIKDLPMPVDVDVGLNWEDLEYGKNIMYNFTLEGNYMYDKEIEDELRS